MFNEISPHRLRSFSCCSVYWGLKRYDRTRPPSFCFAQYGCQVEILETFRLCILLFNAPSLLKFTIGALTMKWWLFANKRRAKLWTLVGILLLLCFEKGILFSWRKTKIALLQSLEDVSFYLKWTDHNRFVRFFLAKSSWISSYLDKGYSYWYGG